VFKLVGRLATATALTAVLVSGGAARETKLPAVGAQVYVYPEKLTPPDVLTFGESEMPIEIQGETTLVWVDLLPGARFGHPTECVLISAAGTRVVKGDWWLVLNGKTLFRDGKAYKSDFPVTLAGK
jgi:uncharacterized Zn-binding protein involved in type VI secretion